MPSSEGQNRWLAEFGDEFEAIVKNAEVRLLSAARVAVGQNDDDAIATMSLMTAMITSPTFQSPLVLSILLARRAVLDARLVQRNEGR